jgi:hypothetical protein
MGNQQLFNDLGFTNLGQGCNFKLSNEDNDDYGEGRRKGGDYGDGRRKGR